MAQLLMAVLVGAVVCALWLALLYGVYLVLRAVTGRR